MDPETVPPCDSATHWPETWFLRSAAVLLILTALAKGFSALGSNTILEKPDPVFWVLKNRELLVLVGVVEMAVAGLLLSSMPVKVRRGGLLWLCANFLLYRAGLWMTGSAPSCKCMGDLAGQLDLSDAQASWIMLGILGYLFGGSLFFLWRSRSARVLDALTERSRGGPGLRAH